MSRTLKLTLLAMWVAIASGCNCSKPDTEVNPLDPELCTDPCPKGEQCEPSTGRCVVTAPPDTAIALAPPSLTTSGAARFEFAANKSPATFVCQLDSGPELACSSPFVTTVPDGSHVFSVTAIDQDGHRDPSPATYTWVVDSTPPIVTIEAPTQDEVTGPDVSVRFVFSEVATASCRVNGAAASACESPLSLSGLPSGPNLFEVSGTDAVGNLSAPATVSFKVNRGPTLTVASALETLEDTPLGPVSFTVADPDTALALVSVSVSSSDTVLFPPGSLVLGGGEESRTLRATPAANTSGVATLTFTAFDGYVTATATLQLTVTPVDDGPAISSLANQAIPKGGATGALGFTVSDFETPAGQLTVTATSSNASLLPLTGIALGGSDGDRTITLTPLASQTGATTVTVTVSDGAGTASTSFVLTVGSANQPPTISDIPDQLATEDAPGPAVPFTVADIDTPLNTLALTASSSDPLLLPNANLVFGGGGASRTIAVTPAPNRSGVAVVTVSVTDGVGSATDTFRVTVSSVNDAPTISPVGDQVIAEGGATPAIPFTVGDVETLAAELVVTASSSNQALVPAANLVLGGAGANRSIRATGLPNQSGATTVTLTVSDGTSNSSTSFLVTVTAINDKPTISAPPAQAIAEDTSTGAIAFTVNDAETPPGSLVVAASSSNPTLIPDAAANLTLGGTGANRTVTVTPAANQSGSGTVVLTVSDGAMTMSSAFVVTVTPVNDAPTLAAIAARSTPEDTASSLTVAVTDVDDTTGAFSASSSNPALVPSTEGSPGWSFSGAGLTRTLTLTPNPNATGTADITVTFTDPGGLSASQTFTLTVTPVNDPPTMAVIPDRTTTEDTPTSLTVTITDLDDTTGAFSAHSSNPAVLPDASGAPGWSFSGAGLTRSLTLTPAAEANTTAGGPVAVTVTFTDPGGLTASQTFNLTVEPVNDPPTISTIANQSIPEDSATGPLAFSVSDVETPAGGLSVTASSSNPALLPQAGLALGGSGGARTVTLTPSANQAGTAVVTLTVSDGAATTSSTFVLTVGGTNDAPTLAAPAAQTIAEDTSTGALAFPVDDLDSPVASLVVTASSSNPVLVPNLAANLVVGGAGATRSIEVRPAANQSGDAVITLTVTDGLASASAQFTVTVTPVNDAPTVAAPGDQLVPEDTATAALAFTVSDLETAAASLTVTASSSNPALVPSAPANLVLGGTGANRTIAIVPAANQTGVTTITLTVSDGATSAQGTFVVTVTPVNDAPTLTVPGNQVVSEDTSTAALPFTVGDLETAPGSLIVTASSSNPSVAPLANLALGGAGANRTITVTPAANQSGSAVITLTVSDGAASAQGTFQVTVTPANDPPVMAAIGPVSTPEDTAVPVTVTVSDLDDITGTFSASSANPALVPNAGLAFSGTGLSRTLTMTPAANATGPVDITATFTDAGGLAASRTFTLTITPTNDAPTMTAIAAQTTNEDVPLGVAVTVADADDTTGTFTATSSNTAVIPNVVGAPGVAFSGAGLTRTLTLSPVANTNTTAQGPVSITVTFTDSGGLSASRTFALTVNPADDAPTMAALGPVSTPEDTPVSVTVTVTDLDDTTGTFSASSSNLALLPNTNLAFAGAGLTRTLTLTPSANASGAADVTVTFSDSGGLATSRTFTLTVTPVNDAPVMAALGPVSTPEDTPVPVTVTVTDVDDTTGTFAASSNNLALLPNANLAFSGAGLTRTLTLTPSANTTGAADVTVSFTDSGGVSASRTFTLTVTPANDAPAMAALGPVSTPEDTPVPVTVTVTDLDDTTGTFVASSSNLTLLPNANLAFSGAGLTRTLTLTPSANASGTANVTVTFTDSGGLSASRTFTLTVSPVNDAPTLAAIAAQSTNEDTPLNVAVAAADVEDTTGTFAASSSNLALLPNANLAFAGSGLTRTLTLTPAANATGAANVTVTFTDTGGLAASTTFTLTVIPVNDAPTLTVMANLTGTVAGAAVTTSTTLDDLEDTNEATATLAVGTTDPTLFPVAGGIAVSSGSPTRTITLTPAASRGGSATVTASYTDSGGLSATRTFTATIPIRATASASGPGTATVTATGCAAGASCDVVASTALTFVATPGASGVFTGWTGSCAGLGATATLAAGNAWLACTANFGALWAVSHELPGNKFGARENTVRDFARLGTDTLRVLTSDLSTISQQTAAVVDLARADGSVRRASVLYTTNSSTGAQVALAPGDIVQASATTTLAMVSTRQATAGVWLDEAQTVVSAFTYAWDQSEAQPYDAIALKNGDFAYVEGYQPGNAWNGRLVRLDAKGAVLWATRFCDKRTCTAACANTVPIAVAELDDGALIVASLAYWPDPITPHLLVTRFESKGTSTWQQHLYVSLASRFLWPTAIAAVSATEVAISGYLLDPIAGATATSDMFVLRANVSTDFKPVWFTRLGNVGLNDAAGQLVPLPGAYIVSGWSTRAKTGADLVNLVLKDDGQSLGAGFAYGGLGEDVGYYLQPAETSGYYVVGSSSSFATQGANAPWALHVDDALGITFNASSGAIRESLSLPLTDETKNLVLPETCNDSSAQTITRQALNATVTSVKVNSTRQAP
jgi:hypothetical protein